MTIKKAKIIFLGTPEFAATILEILADSPYRPSLVITETDKPAGRQQRLTPPPVKLLANKLGIPVTQPANRAELLLTLENTKPELGIVAAYGRILTPAMLTVTTHGFLNVHPSLLPKYRGATPIQAAILAGDHETGVTIMQMDAGMDTGAIISWSTIPLDSTETVTTLTDSLAEIGGALLTETIPGYLNGTIQPQPQDNEQATTTRLLAKDSGKLTGSLPPEQIARILRAYTPWPGLWVELDNQRILLLAGHREDNHFIPDKVQLAGKKPVSWQQFQADRPKLAEKFHALLDLTK